MDDLYSTLHEAVPTSLQLANGIKKIEVIKTLMPEFYDIGGPGTGSITKEVQS